MVDLHESRRQDDLDESCSKGLETECQRAIGHRIEAETAWYQGGDFTGTLMPVACILVSSCNQELSALNDSTVISWTLVISRQA